MGLEGSDPSRGKRLFSSPRSRPGLQPNQLLIQWIPGTCSLE